MPLSAGVGDDDQLDRLQDSRGASARERFRDVKMMDAQQDNDSDSDLTPPTLDENANTWKIFRKSSQR